MSIFNRGKETIRFANETITAVEALYEDFRNSTEDKIVAAALLGLELVQYGRTQRDELDALTSRLLPQENRGAGVEQGITELTIPLSRGKKGQFIEIVRDEDDRLGYDLRPTVARGVNLALAEFLAHATASEILGEDIDVPLKRGERICFQRGLPPYKRIVPFAS